MVRQQAPHCRPNQLIRILFLDRFLRYAPKYAPTSPKNTVCCNGRTRPGRGENLRLAKWNRSRPAFDLNRNNFREVSEYSYIPRARAMSSAVSVRALYSRLLQQRQRSPHLLRLLVRPSVLPQVRQRLCLALRRTRSSRASAVPLAALFARLAFGLARLAVTVTACATDRARRRWRRILRLMLVGVIRARAYLSGDSAQLVLPSMRWQSSGAQEPRSTCSLPSRNGGSQDYGRSILASVRRPSARSQWRRFRSGSLGVSCARSPFVRLIKRWIDSRRAGTKTPYGW